MSLCGSQQSWLHLSTRGTNESHATLAMVLLYLTPFSLGKYIDLTQTNIKDLVAFILSNECLGTRVCFYKCQLEERQVSKKDGNCSCFSLDLQSGVQRW